MDITHTTNTPQPTLELVFAEAGPGPTLRLGPFPAVRIDGECMRNDGTKLGEHHAHSWIVQGRRFFRVDCESPVRLHFENEKGETSPVSGPFMHFSCADGVAYADGMIYGNIDLETKLWWGHQDRKYWRTLIIKSASAPPA
jgi:hypothetical protein